MSNNISIEEYNKLKSDIEYWKARALNEENLKKFYKNRYKEEASGRRRYYEKGIELARENQLLKRKIKELEKEKVTFISFKGVNSLKEAKKLAEKIRETINREHHCNRNCFKEHILPAIQNDYDKFEYNSNLLQNKFFEYWNEKLINEYNFVKSITLVNGKIVVRF